MTQYSVKIKGVKGVGVVSITAASRYMFSLHAVTLEVRTMSDLGMPPRRKAAPAPAVRNAAMRSEMATNRIFADGSMVSLAPQADYSPWDVE
ncbi:Hypothetical protein AT6N2_L2403 [Agrobacterium tumefaciens]|nr:Hypothetical protein AT6N2_L2403 [Agrobacterium tumefaciens]